MTVANVYGRAPKAGNLLFFAAVLTGSTYALAGWTGLGGSGVVIWKGGGVGLLALWAFTQVRSRDGRWFAAMLAAGGIGDVLLDAFGLLAGGVAFLVAHALAIVFYLRHRCGATPWTMVAAGAVSVPGWPMPSHGM